MIIQSTSAPGTEEMVVRARPTAKTTTWTMMANSVTTMVLMPIVIFVVVSTAVSASASSSSVLAQEPPPPPPEILSSTIDNLQRLQSQHEHRISLQERLVSQHDRLTSKKEELKRRLGQLRRDKVRRQHRDEVRALTMRLKGTLEAMGEELAASEAWTSDALTIEEEVDGKVKDEWVSSPPKEGGEEEGVVEVEKEEEDEEEEDLMTKLKHEKRITLEELQGMFNISHEVNPHHFVHRTEKQLKRWVDQLVAEEYRKVEDGEGEEEDANFNHGLLWDAVTGDIRNIAASSSSGEVQKEEEQEDVDDSDEAEEEVSPSTSSTSATTAHNGGRGSEEQRVLAKTGACVTEEEATTMASSLLRSLDANETRTMDYALYSNGGRIVYVNDMTSETYHHHHHHRDKSGEESILVPPSVIPLLGMDWWEGLTTAPMTTLEQIVHRVRNVDVHELRESFVKGSSMLWRTLNEPPRRRSRTADELLSPNVQLGNCWPMVGHVGKFTIRFDVPVRVTSFTLDHVSPALEPPGAAGGQPDAAGVGTSFSAPRYFRVVGYPPCSGASSAGEGQEEGRKRRDQYLCNALGFDVHSPVDMGEFEYHRPTPLPVDEDDDDDDEGEGDVMTSKNHMMMSSLPYHGTSQHFPVGDHLSGRPHYDVSRTDEQSLEEEVMGIVDEEDFFGSSVGGGRGGEVEESIEGGCTISSCSPPEAEASAAADGDVEEGDNVGSTSEEGNGGDSSYLGGIIAGGHSGAFVQAVTVVIEDNWGNDDYTCIYRFRVHGEADAAR